ncbi:MAG: ATP-binding protein [Synergistaceae bacterium]|nr:ATP-binding protein [Synergistaceae bacterium]
MVEQKVPKKLPIGIQTFENIIQDNYLYVDKTKYLVELIDDGKVYFLSRPRRFGKSLTLSTFDALFSGKEELFRGLDAEEFFGRAEYRVSPVVRLDLSQVGASGGIDALEDGLKLQVMRNAERHSVAISALAMKHAQTAFDELLYRVFKALGPAVVLIDEYDKPVLDVMHDPAKAEDVRVVMRDFYTQIKAQDASLRFVFMTGITKFSKMGVFSAMNSLEDISMEERYGTMLGYTGGELENYFAPYIDEMAESCGYGREELLAEIRDYYDGFSFDGETMLYNPFSTLNLFRKKKFLNFWFETGTPSYIAQYMKDRKLTVDEFRGVGVSRDFAASPGAIENADAKSFLYQSGYLTLRPGVINDYSLDYPNHEVLASMSRLLTENILGSREEAESAAQRVKQCLYEGSVDGFVGMLNRLLAAIPYDDYERAARKTIEYRGYRMDAGEWLYRSTLLSYLIGMGLDVEAEPHTSGGRADMRIKFKGRVWIIELKVARGEAGAKKSADEAMEQISSKGYAERYEGAILLSCAIDDERRAITEYRTNAGKPFAVDCCGKA